MCDTAIITGEAAAQTLKDKSIPPFERDVAHWYRASRSCMLATDANSPVNTAAVAKGAVLICVQAMLFPLNACPVFEHASARSPTR